MTRRSVHSQRTSTFSGRLSGVYPEGWRYFRRGARLDVDLLLRLMRAEALHRAADRMLEGGWHLEKLALQLRVTAVEAERGYALTPLEELDVVGR